MFPLFAVCRLQFAISVLSFVCCGLGCWSGFLVSPSVSGSVTWRHPDSNPTPPFVVIVVTVVHGTFTNLHLVDLYIYIYGKRR